MNQTSPQPFDQWADQVAATKPEAVLEILQPVFDLLDTCHRRGQPHGALRPENLLVDGVKIDLAHLDDSSRGEMDESSGYAPPEAYAEGSIAPTAAGDIYSLAAVLFRALSGTVPANGIRRPLPLVQNFPGIRVAVNRALEEKPEDRPGSLKEFRDLLTKPAPLPEPVAPRPLTVLDEIEMPTQPAPAEKSEVAPEPAPVEKAEAAPAVPSAEKLENLPEPPPAVPPPKLPPAPKVVPRLPKNLTVGRQEVIPVKTLFKEYDDAWSIKFTNAAELGIPCDTGQRALVGAPTLSGEQELVVRYFLSGQEETSQPELRIKVTINPDPDSLWKNLPSKQDDPYWKTDSDESGETTPAARIIAASVRGRSHAHEGLFRDDDFLSRYDVDSGWHLLAVADGAGSAKYSRRGSQIACQVALDFMGKFIAANGPKLDHAVDILLATSETESLRTAAYSWLPGAAFAARKTIQAEAEAHQPPALLKDYATTLLLAAAKKIGSKWVFVSFSIGDGGIGLLRPDGSVMVLSSPDSGEFSGQTLFLTAPAALNDGAKIKNRIHATLADDFTALVLMTDGITDPKFPTEVSLGDPTVWKSFWDDLSAKVAFPGPDDEAAAQLLAWLSFRSPGNHDDRTILVLLPRTDTP